MREKVRQIGQRVQNKYFKDELPIKLRLFNMIVMAGGLGGIISTVISLVLRLPIGQVLASAAAFLLMVFCFYLANNRGKLMQASFLTCFLVANFLFPVMFFTGGGIYGGMSHWFAMGILFVFLLLDGKGFWITLVTNIIVILASMLVSYYHPEFVVNLGGKYQIFLDLGQSILITALGIGCVMRFQVYIFNNMFQKLEEQNEKLLYLNLETEKAKQEAMVAAQAKSDFLAGMSHELRTPINTIMGMNEMILREAEQETIREYSTDIETSIQALLSTVNDVLDMSNIENGKMELKPNRYYLRTLLRDLVNITLVKAQTKKLELQVQVEPSLPNILFGDSPRLRQILLNLLDNAVKYTKEGYIVLTVRGTVEKEKEAVLYFEVKDTGMGIKKEDISRLFDAFERVEKTQNLSIQGMGLGLSISNRFLQMMGSELKVQSVYGVGSIFSFTLRQEILGTEQVGEFPLREKRIENKEAADSGLYAPHARVLVVDDNAMNRKIFRLLLKESGIQVTEADSGAACIQQVCREHFDLIFLDHMMPEMDGVDTLQRMKDMNGNLCKDTPVIALTANALAGMRDFYMSKGFDEYLSKPITPDRLEKMIRQMLSDSGLLEDAPPSQSMELSENGRREENEELPENGRREEHGELPGIEGVSWEQAREFFPTEELLRETAVDFYQSLQGEIDYLTGLWQDIEKPEVRRLYQTRVHSMKSSAAMLGALPLSELAKAQEYACRDGDEEQLYAGHPVLLENLRIYQERFSIFAAKDEEKELLTDRSQIMAMMEMLKNAMLEMDVDRADELMRQLNSFCYEEPAAGVVKTLDELVRNLESEQTAKVVNDFIQGKY